MGRRAAKGSGPVHQHCGFVCMCCAAQVCGALVRWAMDTPNQVEPLAAVSKFSNRLTCDALTYQVRASMCANSNKRDVWTPGMQ